MVQRQLQQYPQSRLLDIYKSCFQDYMGPEHLVGDTASARHYLMQELSQMANEPANGRFVEPCGLDGRYCRVYLDAVVQGRVDVDVLLNAFVRSSLVEHPSIEQWREQWGKIQQVLSTMGLELENYQADSASIVTVLQSGNYAMSHSETYRNAYHPHYRIIEKGIFEKDIKPLIDR